MANATKKSPVKSPRSNMSKGENDSLLQEFFVEEIKDIYNAEKHIIKTLPKMMKASTSPELKQAFQEHLDVTKTQVTRLEKVFELLGKKPQTKKFDEIDGINRVGENIIKETKYEMATRDVGRILASKKVKHYEIATYGGLAKLALTLGMKLPSF